jgi:ATP-dependent Lon protease
VALAWTSSGGEILLVEAAVMPGQKALVLTGHLGEIMKESAQAALSFIRTQAQALGIEPSFFDGHDIHIHVPGGAVAKDGPSAGVAVAAALASAVTRRPVARDLGMTGEITLRGQILPVGGIKEKMLAAQRAGLKTLILPRTNEVDLDDVPVETRRALRLIFLDEVSELLKVALGDHSSN